jgi:hypothetical protein
MLSETDELCWKESSRWDIVFVLDPSCDGFHQLYFFDYEDDDEDEKQFHPHSRRLPLESLLSNCPEGATFSERSRGKSLVPIY